MKKTIEISDAVFIEVKAPATRAGVTIRQLVEQGLQHVLGERKQPTSFKLRGRLPWIGWRPS